MNYYNEFDPYPAQWLRNLIALGFLPPGDVDTRSIKDVRADDLKGYTQCHFFAGIGGWSNALAISNWPADKPVWTGSCPCQPFSVAGKQQAQSDDRHLWPIWFNLIRECRPPTIFGEQVAGAIAHGWLDDVYQGLEMEGYAVASAVLPACGVGAPHKRDRLWFVAHTDNQGRQHGAEKRRSNGTGDKSGEPREQFGIRGQSETLGHATGEGSFSTPHTGIYRSKESPRSRNEQFERSSSPMAYPNDTGPQGWHSGELSECTGQQPIGTRSTFITDADCKPSRRFAESRGECNFWEPESSICKLANGVPVRVGRLRAYGNAIVPQLAAEFISAFMECRP